MAVPEQEVTAAAFELAFKSGYQARFNGRPRRPPYDEHDLAFTWLFGWRSADDKIFEFWRG
jgi:ribosome modulation factor